MDNEDIMSLKDVFEAIDCCKKGRCQDCPLLDKEYCMRKLLEAAEDYLRGAW